MLSQKIALYNGLTGPKESIEKKIALQEFEKGFQILESSRFVQDDKFITADLFSREGGVKTLTLNYLKINNSPQDSGLENVRDFSLKVLNAYDAFTKEVQREAEKDFSWGEKLELFFYLLTLVILFFEVVYIFRPLLMSMEKTFDELDNSKEAVVHLSNLSSLGESISTLGHEISNPLTVIKLTNQAINKELTSNGKGNEALSKKSSAIAIQVERIEKTIDTIRNLSRKSGSDPYISFHISKIIEEALCLHTNRIKNNYINLIDNSVNFQGLIDCRPGELVQVVSNLIGNAIDSLIEANITDPKIEIRLREEGDLFYLCILDNGPGVTSEHIDKIFQAFYTTKPQGKGTGLGLSISKQIIENHGGQIYINKAISNSCFELRMPLKKQIVGVS